MMDVSILSNNLNDQVPYEDYFKALGYRMDDPIFFRTFYDPEKNGEAEKSQAFLRHIDGELRRLRYKNIHNNHGVFYVVNGGGQKDSAVKEAKALFIDFDDFSFEEQIRRLNSFPLEPSTIVKTKKSLHAYWILIDHNVLNFRGLQQRLIHYFGSDPVIKNESRVMRLYGFEHRKDPENPVMVTLIKFNPELKYKQEDFDQALPRLKPEVSKTATERGKNNHCCDSSIKVEVGKRYRYIISYIGKMVWKLAATSTDEEIFSLVKSNAFRVCEDIDQADNEETFRKKYFPVIQKFRKAQEAAATDPEFNSYAFKAWKAENPEKQYSADYWEEIRAAGLAAKAEGKVFSDKSGEKKNKPIPPTEEEKAALQPVATYEPEDYSDLGQVKAFLQAFGNMRVRYSDATKFLSYTGKLWKESDVKAQGWSQYLTDMQLEEAESRMEEAEAKITKALEEGTPANAPIVEFLDEELAKAKAYYNYVIHRRYAKKFTDTLSVLRPYVQVDVEDLDRDAFLLNTPGGTVDLRTGEIKNHDPHDYCTKITNATPGNDGMEKWDDFLNLVTENDKEMKVFLQKIAGMCAIGRVKLECLVLAHGDGGNGKSTFFNVLAMVLGDYSYYIDTDVLVKRSKRNTAPDIAELRGRRLAIAKELEEGDELCTSRLKNLCSTDKINGAKKFKDPFDFWPSHSLILYTNHLPAVGAIDNGTWDRLIPVPFNAHIRNEQAEIKDYASILFRDCAGAILSWIVEGSKMFINDKYKITLPECVKADLEEYKSNCDWVLNFINDCCETGKGKEFQESGSDLYKTYRKYCDSVGICTKHITEFSKALRKKGFLSHKDKRGVTYFGIKIAI